MLIKTKRIPVLNLLLISWWPSIIKNIYYRLLGYKLGKNVHIGFGSLIEGRDVIIEDRARIGFFSIILCKECKIGSDVEIGSFVYFKVDKIEIGYQTIIRENNLFGGMDIGKSEIKIGFMSHIHQRCFVNTTMPVKIGSNTAIGGGSYIFTHSSWQSVLEGYPCTFDTVEIGDNVWISWNVFILPSVKIGNGTLVSAGAVVTKSLPEKCLASGNPAKPVIPSGMFPRSLPQDERGQLVFSILAEFKLYLESNGYTIAIEQNQMYHYYRILISNKRPHHLYAIINSKIDLAKIKQSKNLIIMSLTPLSQDSKEIISKRSIPIIDLEEMIVIGKNSLLEELVKFLKHYGIRLRYLSF